MQHCAKCGNYNTADNIFCSTCGNRLNNNCPACGFANLPQQQFCGSCGKQLAAESAAALGGTVSESGPPPGATAQTSPIYQQQAATATLNTGGNPAESAEARFDSPADLQQYALISIEFANWDQVKAQAANPEQPETARRQSLTLIEERVLAAGGRINASKSGILFASFRHEGTVEASIEQAVQLSLALLAESFRFGDQLLKLRIGMDLENAGARNPLTSTLERSVALPGTLTVSEKVQQHIHARYRMEPIGPVPLGNQMMTFYRVIRPGNEPRMEDFLQPAPEAFAPAPPPAPPPAAPPAPVAPPPVSSPEAAYAPEATEAAETPQAEAAAPEAQEPVSPPAPEEESGEAPPPPPVKYDPPVLGMTKTTRHANLDYEKAIEALTSELSAFLAQGVRNKGKIISVCGSDGLGKSSIVNMARAKVDPNNQRAFWMGGHNYRCFKRNDLPLYYWLEMVQNLLSLVFEGQMARDVKEHVSKFLMYIYEGEIPQDDLSFLCDFLSINPPQPLSVELTQYIGRVENFFFDFFRSLSTRRPLILVIEDLSFADPASLELMSRLIERGILDHPVYFVVTQTRDFYAAGRLMSVIQKITHKEIVVSELDDAEAERFLNDGPLGGRIADFPVQMIDILIQHAKGSPLYLEEALRLFHLQEILTIDDQTHKFVMKKDFNPAEALLPGNVRDLVKMRLNHLSDKTLYLLRLAAVLGEKFAVSLLVPLSQMDEEECNQSLTTLYHHGYLVPDAVNTGRFRHGQIWEAVYEDIDEELRIQMHQLISETLENDFKQSLTVNPMLIAYHAENGHLPNRALNYWNLAGIYCAEVGSLIGMNMAMFRAIELLREVSHEPLHHSEMALRIAEGLGAFNAEGNPDLAVGLLEWVIYYRRKENDPAKLIEPLGLLATAYEKRGEFTQALSASEQALQFLDPQNYPLEYASFLLYKLEYLYTLGRLQQARDVIDQSIEPIAIAQGYEHGDPNFFDAYLNARLIKGQILLAQCDNGCITVVEECLKHARERGLEGLSIALQMTMGQIFLRNGQYDSCNREADSLLSQIESLEDHDWFLAQWGLLAIMYHCELEDWESASQLILTIISKSEDARDYLTWILAQTYAGHITGKLGKTKEARQLLEQGIKLSSDFRFAASALLGWRLLADFELSLGNKEVALEIATKALDIGNKPEIQNTYEVMQLTLVAARALIAQGNVKQAGKMLEPMWPLAIKSKMQPLIAQCAFEIGNLYKAMAQDAPADLSKKHLMRSVEFFLKAKGIWLELRHLPHVRRVDAAIPQL